jgi:hypothetical protein
MVVLSAEKTKAEKVSFWRVSFTLIKKMFGTFFLFFCVFLSCYFVYPSKILPPPASLWPARARAGPCAGGLFSSFPSLLTPFLVFPLILKVAPQRLARTRWVFFLGKVKKCMKKWLRLENRKRSCVTFEVRPAALENFFSAGPPPRSKLDAHQKMP